MLSKVHHVGIVVRSADDALGFYRDALGLPVSVDRVIEDQGSAASSSPAATPRSSCLSPRATTPASRASSKAAARACTTSASNPTTAPPISTRRPLRVFSSSTRPPAPDSPG